MAFSPLKGVWYFVFGSWEWVLESPKGASLLGLGNSYYILYVLGRVLIYTSIQIASISFLMYYRNRESW